MKPNQHQAGANSKTAGKKKQAAKMAGAGQTHLNFYAQQFEQVAVVPAGVLLLAPDAALLGRLAL